MNLHQLGFTSQHIITSANKINQGYMARMQVFKIIREKLGLKPWKMKQLLGIDKIQSYLYLERHANKVSLEDLTKLKEISGASLQEFWGLIEEEVKAKK